MEELGIRMLELERAANGVVWGVPGMALILGTGLLLSALCGFPQFIRPRNLLRGTLGRALKRRERQAGSVSPFSAMCTALAASIGTGNIAGAAGAIALGGPGAVFWMWVSALVGMGTKYAEVALAVHYRERNARGEWVGGPMYYIRSGLGLNWLAALFAVFGGVASFGTGNLIQVNTIAAAINQAVSSFVPTSAEQQRTIALAVGILCAGVVLAVLVGGVRRIGEVCSLLVPVMAGMYLLAALTVILFHAGQVPGAFRAILVGAFCPQAVAGGLAGVGIRRAITSGVGRGIFSNEAGLGSAPIAHAAADAESPAAQGLWGVFEVFLDTIVICTVTALVVLLGVGVESIPYGTNQGVELALLGFRSVFAGPAPAVAVAVCLSLFALSTVLTWGLYGARCFEFLLGERAVRPYQILFALGVAAGGLVELEVAWNIADTLNGLMAVPNLAALIALSPTAARLARESPSPAAGRRR